MSGYKVEICGVNTAKLPLLSNEEKEELFLAHSNYYYAIMGKYRLLPGKVIAYWVPFNITEIFKNSKLGDLCEVRQGMTTSDNNRFLRLWFEVNINNESFKWIKCKRFKAK